MVEKLTMMHHGWTKVVEVELASVINRL